MRRLPKVLVENIIISHIVEKENFYRDKLQSNAGLICLVNHSLRYRDTAILKYLIINEFPELTNQLLRYLLIAKY